jgi:tetratricopeptide (TPR) repeat protein
VSGSALELRFSFWQDKGRSQAGKHGELPLMSSSSHLPSAGDSPAMSSNGWAPPTRGLEARTINQTVASTLIDAYEVLGELGRGAFGVVYRARDTKLNRPVAIKVLQVGADASDDELARFRGEAEALGSLQHANIVQVYNTGVHRGMPYLVMELVEGGNLFQQLHGQPRQVREAAALVETIARAIHAAHDKGIVHRDLKPANILLSVEGTPKITDFGLAKRLDHSLGLSRTGQAIGTPSYMAPEQAEGKKDIGPGADVYALGAILYELLTGRPPFRGPDILAVLEQVRGSDPLSPSRLVPRLPRDLSTICLKCLEKSPERRYSSALELADDLRRYLDGHAIVARPAGRLERLWRVVRRRPLQAALASVTVLVAVLVAVLSWVLVEDGRQKKIAELKREQEQAIHQKEEQIQKFTQDEHERSLGALDGILRLVLKGPLSNKPGLEPLHRELLDYYEKLIQRQEQSDLAPPDKLAEACLRLGLLIHKTGKLADARNALDRAERLYVRLSQAAPDRPDSRRRLARTRLERGRVLEGLGLVKPARADYESALALLEQLHRDWPAEPRNQRDLGEVLQWLAVLCAGNETDAGRKEALGYYRRALALRQDLCQRKAPIQGDRADLARTQGFLGDLLLEMSDLAGADAAYWESHRIREKLAKDDPENDDAHFQLARSYANFANYQIRVRALDTAINFLEQTLKLRRELVARNPAVTEYQTDLADVCGDTAELLLLRGGTTGNRERRQRALELAREAEAIYRRQQKSDEQSINVRRGLAESLTLRARLLVDTAPAEAGPLLIEAEVLFRKVLQQRDTADSYYQLAAVHALQAELGSAAGREARVKDALVALQKASELHFRRLHPRDVELDRAFKALHDRPEFRAVLARGQ